MVRRPDTEARRPRDWQTIARVVGILVVLLLFTLFIVNNAQSVQIHFLTVSVNTHLSWALVIAGVLGVLIGLLIPYLRRFA